MVAGEVDATDAVLHNVRGYPTEKKLAEKVLALPEQVRGKTLIPAAASGDIAPCTKAGKVIKASITHGRFKLGKLITMKDNYSLSDAAGEALAGGAHIVEQDSLDAFAGGTRLVLKDHDEKPLALAFTENANQHRAYMICSLTPLFDKDEPIYQEGNCKFYPMFKMSDIDKSHLDFRALLVWNGKNYQPFLKVLSAVSLPVPDTPASGREHDVLPKKGDTLVVDPNDLNKVYAILAKKPTSVTSRIAGWDLIIAPGADVGCMLILGAILDDMVGWFA